MLIAHDVIDSLTKHERFKEALEELAVHPMSEFGVPSVANTFTAHLDAGKRTVRIRIEMVPDQGPQGSRGNDHNGKRDCP